MARLRPPVSQGYLKTRIPENTVFCFAASLVDAN